jgi:hypothetical protein
MANELVTIGQRALALRAERAEQLKKVSDAAKKGLFAGAPPSIGCKGTRFIVKNGISEKVLDVLQIKGIILAAKGSFDKAYYMKVFVPGDAEAPDCFSRDGERPDPQAKEKQNSACAGCPRNCFGTGKDSNGNPTAGKACADSKVVAITVGERNEDKSLLCYQFKIPPASLGAWNKYVQELDQHGAYLPEVITEVGFNAEKSYPQYTFKMIGTVPDEMIEDVYTAMDSEAVKDIVADKATPAPAPPTEPITKIIEAEEEVVIKEEDTVFGNLKLGGETTPSVEKSAKEEKVKAIKKVKEVKAEELVVIPKEETVVVEAPKEEPKAFGGFTDAALNAKLGL